MAEQRARHERPRALRIAAAAALLLPPTAAAAADTRELDRDGLWTLSRLGSGALELTGPGTVRAARFRLPAGTAQGKGRWYLVRLRFALTLAAGTPPGIVYVSASTNGRAAAQIKVEPTRDSIVWSSVGLIDGRVERRVAGRRIEVDFRNYLQTAGVRPGLNTLTVALERVGGVRVERLSVFSDSGIERTRLAPAKVRLEPVLPAGEVRVGDEFELGFRVRNAGGRTAHGVVVAVDYPAGALAAVGPRLRRFPQLTRTATGSFRMRALERGRFQVTLAAKSNANRPVALIDVPVGADEGNRLGLATLVVGAVLLLAGVFLFRTR